MRHEGDDDRQRAAALIAYSRPPTVSDLDDMRARIRSILNEYEGGNYLFVLPLCAQLFKWGTVEDSLLIYRAKQTGWDAHNSISIEWTCGAGIGPTRTFLQSSDDPIAKEILAYIDNCIASGGAFRGFDPAEWFSKQAFQL